MNPTAAWIIAGIMAVICIYLVIYWEEKAKAERKRMNQNDWNRKEIDRKLEPDWDITDRIYHTEVKETARNRQLV